MNCVVVSIGKLTDVLGSLAALPPAARSLVDTMKVRVSVMWDGTGTLARRRASGVTISNIKDSPASGAGRTLDSTAVITLNNDSSLFALSLVMTGASPDGNGEELMLPFPADAFDRIALVQGVCVCVCTPTHLFCFARCIARHVYQLVHCCADGRALHSLRLRVEARHG